MHARWPVWSICAGWAESFPRRSPRQPRPGNAPWRTVETPAGLLNSIGLDNDGIESFVAPSPALFGDDRLPGDRQHCGIQSARISIAGASDWSGQPGVAALELNISCPNVSGGVDFGTQSRDVPASGSGRSARRPMCPLLAKLTPNVTDIVAIAQAAHARAARMR